MKKLIILLFAVLLPLSFWAQTQAAGGGYPLDNADVDLGDRPSLQRGAKYYVNYCMGCHALGYQRFNRVGKDLGLTDKELLENLIFTSNKKGEQKKVGDLMTIAMDTDYAEAAFGVVPPDLNLIARSRGADWLYTYLRTFYKDDSRAFGANNAAFPLVGMPNVLQHLQGEQQPVYEEHDDGHGHTSKVITGFEIIKEGELNVEEFDQVALDITNFLVYSGEPAKMVRGKLGFWVLLFLGLFGWLAYQLKKEYWKDVH